MEINGLPLHPLAVHAAVVLGPLAALVAAGYAGRPAWRWLLRWPMVVAAVVAALAVSVSVLSGQDLLDSRPGLEQLPAVQDHQDRAWILLWVSVSFVGATLLAAWALGGPSALKSDRGAQETRGALGWVALVVVSAGIVAVLVMTFLTGEAGSRAVWG